MGVSVTGLLRGFTAIRSGQRRGREEGERRTREQEEREQAKADRERALRTQAEDRTSAAAQQRHENLVDLMRLEAEERRAAAAEATAGAAQTRAEKYVPPSAKPRQPTPIGERDRVLMERVSRYIAQGMSPEAARDKARAELGYPAASGGITLGPATTR